jgi:uncharacterized membrane protein
MKKLFATGLVLLLPFLITYLILGYFISFITNPFDWLVDKILDQFNLFEQGFAIFSKKQVTHAVSKCLVLVLFIFFIFLVGFAAHRYSARLLNTWLDGFVGKIPFINKIYAASKELTTVVFTPRDDAVRQPALVPYPSPDEKAIGLLIQNSSSDALADVASEFSLVLIPCTPNPTVGYLCLFPKEQVTLLDLKSEEAMKFLLSCGSIDIKPKN